MTEDDLAPIKDRLRLVKLQGLATEIHHLATVDVPALLDEVDRLRGELAFGHEGFEALSGELAYWRRCVEHVTEAGKTSRCVSSPEGWTLCHTEYHADLLCEVERLTAEVERLRGERARYEAAPVTESSANRRVAVAVRERNEAQTEVERLRDLLEARTEVCIDLLATAARLREALHEAGCSTTSALAALTDSEPVAKWLAEHDAKVREEARGSIPPTAPTCDCIGQFGGHDPRCATVQKPPTEPTEGLAHAFKLGQKVRSFLSPEAPTDLLAALVELEAAGTAPTAVGAADRRSTVIALLWSFVKLWWRRLRCDAPGGRR